MQRLTNMQKAVYVLCSNKAVVARLNWVELTNNSWIWHLQANV